MTIKSIEIIQPDDWHIHLREKEILKAVSKYSFRINNRCIVMPNLEEPITSSKLSLKYKEEIEASFSKRLFTPLIPCYLSENIDLIDFEYACYNYISFEIANFFCEFCGIPDFNIKYFLLLISLIN